MPRRAFRRPPHPAEIQAAGLWLLFFLISVVSVFWLLDLTVVDLLPSSDPFTRYRFKPCRVPRKFYPAAHSSLVTLPPPSRSVTRSRLQSLLLAGASTRVLPQGSSLHIQTRAESRERSRQSPLPNRLSRQIRVVHNLTEVFSDRQLWQERRVAQRIWQRIPGPALPPPRCWPDRGPSGRPCCRAPIRTAKSPTP